MKSPRLTPIAALALVLCALAAWPLLLHAQQGRGQLVIKNRADKEISRLFLSPSKSESWGDDLLGGAAINPGDERTLENLPCDNYRLKIEDGDGNQSVIENVSTCRGRSVVVINNRDMGIKPPMR